MVDIKVDEGILEDLNTGEEFGIKPLPNFMLGIMEEGGLINYLKNHLEEIKND